MRSPSDANRRAAILAAAQVVGPSGLHPDVAADQVKRVADVLVVWLEADVASVEVLGEPS